MGGSALLLLPSLHAPPVDKAVGIVEKKDRKASGDGKIGDVLDGGKHPKKDEHDVVCRVGEGEVGGAARRQVRGSKACGDGKGGKNEVRGVKGVEDKIENDRDHERQKGKDAPFPRVYAPHAGLRVSLVRGITKPRCKRPHRHGERHAEIGDHLPVVGEGIRDHAVGGRKNDHEEGSHGIALRRKDEGGNAHKRGAEVEIIFPVKEIEKRENDGVGKEDQAPLKFRKVTKYFHKNSFQKSLRKKASVYAPSKT